MATNESEQPELVQRLAKASRKAHDISDALVNAKLVALFTDRTLYAGAFGLFYWVFTALEEALQKNAEMPELRPFQQSLTGLFRSEAFATDLQYFLGPDWRSRVVRSKPVQDYEAHLRLLGKEAPKLLLAHAFTQHLAVAAGGQQIRRLARKHMQLPEDKGTAAFEYGELSPNMLKNEFKQQINALGRTLDPSEAQQMVDEHLSAFMYNNAIIRDYKIKWSAALYSVVVLLPARVRLVLAVLLLALLALVAAWLVR